MATVSHRPRVLTPAQLPPALRPPADADPTPTLTVRGNASLLNNRLIGFFCSKSSPGDQTATKRNALVADLATSLLVPHATPGGKVERLCERALARSTPVFALTPSPRLAELGVIGSPIGELRSLLTAALS